MKSYSSARDIIDLNDNWVFFDRKLDTKAVFTAPARQGDKVTLPHAVRVFPHHNFNEKDYQIVTWYRREFKLPARAKDKRIFIEFDGVMLAAKVFVNGKAVGEHKGGFTDFRFDLTKYVTFGSANTVAVQVDSRERPDIPPFGKTVDYLTFGGIYREVRLILTDSLYISDIFPFASNVLTDRRTFTTRYELQNTGSSREVDLRLELLDAGGKVAGRAEQSVAVSAKGPACGEIVLEDLGGIKLWDIDDPYLYTARLSVEENGKPIDGVEKSFGFREARFDRDGAFYLNGRPVKLMGLDRHQNYPYLGPSVGWRMQYRDAEILKNELGLNIVRTSHYPQSPWFLDRCDQIGLLVLEEIPGWQHIGDEKWKEVSCQELREMIVRDRHHPGIVLWGVRINESRDDHDFYTRTNALAHELDPTRPTGGIRYFPESEFLEDVFTFNDFSGQVREPIHTPYLITEFAGHTFPTKTYDNVQRQAEHALLHARVQNQQMGNPKIAGAIGWCAFDYNTHIDFGSGDRICYHGVSDIFRLPKPAAYLYGSQIDPARKVVLELGDHWIRGDWNICMQSLTIFTNCDEVEMTVGKQKSRTYKPDRQRFPHLPHPPVYIENFGDQWGCIWEDLTLVGKIGGKVAAKKKFPADKLPVALKVWTDHNEIVADGRDMTQLSFMMTDKFGNVCPHASGVITIEATDEVQIIGENPFALVGGRGAVYLKAGTRPGTAKITVKSSAGLKAGHTIKTLA